MGSETGAKLDGTIANSRWKLRPWLPRFFKPQVLNACVLAWLMGMYLTICLPQNVLKGKSSIQTTLCICVHLRIYGDGLDVARGHSHFLTICLCFRMLPRPLTRDNSGWVRIVLVQRYLKSPLLSVCVSVWKKNWRFCWSTVQVRIGFLIVPTEVLCPRSADKDVESDEERSCAGLCGHFKHWVKVCLWNLHPKRCKVLISICKAVVAELHKV